MAYAVGYCVHTWEMSALRGWAVAFLGYVATTTSADAMWLTPAAVTTLTALLGTAASVSGNEIAIARGRARMVRVTMIVSMLCGAVIGFLAFRFGVAGVYFAILTIAFAEFARIGFDHFTWVRGSSGLFLPVANYTENDLWNLRGSPRMFYYLMLGLTVGAFVLCHALLRSRMGHYWLAIRESPEAAQALGVNLFRYKMYAVVLSAAMTSLAGVVFAFYYNNLFPEQIFHISRSIELILGPIIGGIGTLVGPLVGAVLLTGLAEGMGELLLALGVDIPGVKQVFYGICLLLVVMFLPDGVWPPIARKLGLGR